MLVEYKKLKSEGERAASLLDAHVTAMKDEGATARLAPILIEIKSELNLHTRLDDFLRLADDESRDSEQKVALAISGWLMGSGDLNMAVALVNVRDLTAKYLRAAQPHEREAILSELKSTDGAELRYVAKILELLAPPMIPVNVAAGDDGQPRFSRDFPELVNHQNAAFITVFAAISTTSIGLSLLSSCLKFFGLFFI